MNHLIWRDPNNKVGTRLRRRAVRSSALLALTLVATVGPATPIQASQQKVTWMSVAHLPPFGGSKARCLEQAPAEVRPHLRLMCDGIKLVRDSSASPKVSAGVDGFTTFTWTACDGPPQLSCYVNGINADWSETFSVRWYHWGCNRACHDNGGTGWADLGTYAGTDYATWNATFPLRTVHDNLVGSGPIWPFARAWANPGYVLARDVFTVTLGWGPFSYTWSAWLWDNLYPGGYAITGMHGSPR